LTHTIESAVNSIFLNFDQKAERREIQPRNATSRGKQDPPIHPHFKDWNLIGMSQLFLSRARLFIRHELSDIRIDPVEGRAQL
jgi:hypothetical protein